jgi:hypothetical protein
MVKDLIWYTSIPGGFNHNGEGLDLVESDRRSAMWESGWRENTESASVECPSRPLYPRSSALLARPAVNELVCTGTQARDCFPTAQIMCEISVKDIRLVRGRQLTIPERARNSPARP